MIVIHSENRAVQPNDIGIVKNLAGDTEILSLFLNDAPKILGTIPKARVPALIEFLTTGKTSE